MVCCPVPLHSEHPSVLPVKHCRWKWYGLVFGLLDRILDVHAVCEHVLDDDGIDRGAICRNGDGSVHVWRLSDGLLPSAILAVLIEGLLLVPVADNNTLDSKLLPLLLHPRVAEMAGQRGKV